MGDKAREIVERQRETEDRSAREWREGFERWVRDVQDTAQEFVAEATAADLPQDTAQGWNVRIPSHTDGYYPEEIDLVVNADGQVEVAPSNPAGGSVARRPLGGTAPLQPSGLKRHFVSKDRIESPFVDHLATLMRRAAP